MRIATLFVSAMLAFGFGYVLAASDDPPSASAQIRDLCLEAAEEYYRQAINANLESDRSSKRAIADMYVDLRDKAGSECSWYTPT